MKQLLILSGKGGTGKTTIASSFIEYGNILAYADCDVDAPNLHIVLKKNDHLAHRKDYYSLSKAKINQDLCIRCNLCQNQCRFNAINNFQVDYFACEGCGVCEVMCPVDAISYYDDIAGELRIYMDNDTVFSTAELKMGHGTTGMLVSEVKKQLLESENKYKTDIAIIDGSPGIGCPVIASLSGVDLVLIVTEPTLSGLSDMIRIVQTAEKSRVKSLICINKYDIDQDITIKIEEYCYTNNLQIVGKIPFDPIIVKALNHGKKIIELNCLASLALIELFNNTFKILKEV